MLFFFSFLYFLLLSFTSYLSLYRRADPMALCYYFSRTFRIFFCCFAFFSYFFSCKAFFFNDTRNFSDCVPKLLPQQEITQFIRKSKNKKYEKKIIFKKICSKSSSSSSSLDLCICEGTKGIPLKPMKEIIIIISHETNNFLFLSLFFFMFNALEN